MFIFYKKKLKKKFVNIFSKIEKMLKNFGKTESSRYAASATLTSVEEYCDETLKNKKIKIYGDTPGSLG